RNGQNDMIILIGLQGIGFPNNHFPFLKSLSEEYCSKNGPFRTEHALAHTVPLKPLLQRSFIKTQLQEAGFSFLR
ncbi:MAG: hypothetical protein ACOX8S_02220, partial [Christensenellales bacterium]